MQLFALEKFGNRQDGVAGISPFCMRDWLM